MLVSVVTVCYNAVNDIESTIQSVINQTLPKEYIIVDGGSTDGTLNIIDQYKCHLSHLISEPDEGIYDAMKKGLALATGDWILFMNSGDRFVDNHVLESMPLDDKYIAVYGNAIYKTKKSDSVRKGRKESYIGRNMPIAHQAFFVKTKFAREIGFDTRYKYAADYNMIYQLYRKYGKSAFHYVDVNVCIYEAREGYSLLHPNEVFGETILIRDVGIIQIFDKCKYIIKKNLFGYK